MDERTVVLVSLGPRNRTVSFINDGATANDNLKEAIREEFTDVLEPGQDFFLAKISQTDQ